jgi:hypothetical protein
LLTPNDGNSAKRIDADADGIAGDGGTAEAGEDPHEAHP